MTTPDLLTRVCLRCGHRWIARQPEPPKQCPRCHSPYYQRPRRLTSVNPEPGQD